MPVLTAQTDDLHPILNVSNFKLLRECT